MCPSPFSHFNQLLPVASAWCCAAGTNVFTVQQIAFDAILSDFLALTANNSQLNSMVKVRACECVSVCVCVEGGREQGGKGGRVRIFSASLALQSLVVLLVVVVVVVVIAVPPPSSAA